MCKYGIETPYDADNVYDDDMEILDSEFAVDFVWSAIHNDLFDNSIKFFKYCDIDGAELSKEGKTVNVTLVRENFDNEDGREVEFISFDLKMENVVMRKHFQEVEESDDPDDQLSPTEIDERDNPRGSWNVPH
jgi:hypothetical protein